MALVTVGIPTYNRSAYLRELPQTFRDFKLLISDNGSTDGTEDVVREFARADKRIVYHRFAQNCGLARDVGHILMNPDTELVAFLPDDDLWLPHHLARAVDALQTVPNAVLFGCTAEFLRRSRDTIFTKPIGRTARHPVWSLTRQGALRPG